jgi:hypothetical protein
MVLTWLREVQVGEWPSPALSRGGKSKRVEKATESNLKRGSGDHSLCFEVDANLAERDGSDSDAFVDL